jgi:hypothetical protein
VTDVTASVPGADFGPCDLLTHPTEVAATINAITYVMKAMRPLVLEDARELLIALAGAPMLVLNFRVVRNPRLTARG